MIDMIETLFQVGVTMFLSLVLIIIGIGIGGVLRLSWEWWDDQ